MTIRTQNPEYGFFGTIANCRPGCQEELWELAIEGISKELEEMPSYVRPFLDSTAGKQFADCIIKHMDNCTPVKAVALAIREWMSWNDSNIFRNPIPLLVASVHREAIYEEELLGAF